jgi:probable addiction module antidote protein
MPSISHKEELFNNLQDPEFAAEYFNAALEEGDQGILLLAMKNLVDARGGMSKIAEETGLNRESLYRALKEDGNPKIDTFYKVLHAVGIKLLATPENHKAA